MTDCSPKTLQALVQDFFVKHLAIERNASGNTVMAYRDAIKLFLQHASNVKKCSPDQLDHTVLDVQTIRAFLAWLARDRGCGARTRNQRLAALKSLARYVASVVPEHLERCRLIRELPPARFEQPEINYLTEDEVVQLFKSVDATTSSGRRDRALLLLMYNTGARVQELIDLNIGDIHDEAIPLVRLLGKGRKQRTCPLWSRTITAIRQMLAERRRLDTSHPLFVSARGTRLSRSGVAYLLRRAEKNGGLNPHHAKRLSPHVIRHTTAMHLLQSGVDITTIAAWLGHAQLTTTHAYVEIDLRMKQSLIANEAALPEIRHAKYPSPDIVDWLANHPARQTGYVQLKATKRPPKPPNQPSLRITDDSG